MKSIWKFPCPIRDKFEIQMPDAAKVLCVQMQGEPRSPYIWALVDDEQPKVSRRFSLRGTGHPCDNMERKLYVGTFQMHRGSLVFHLFVEAP